MNKGSILTVSKLNLYTKSLLADNNVLANVFVCGEISNLTNHYRSGHIYFSLKDEKSVIRAVMFADNASKLKFTPEDGMKVIVIGKVSMYEVSGQVQIYVSQMQPDGIGELSLTFNQLKEKLEKKNLFNSIFKKELPLYPKRIGVITSDTGAVRRDIETVLSRRYPIVEMVLYASSVQGEDAVPQLINGIKYFNENKVDVIIIGRGGGSLENLWSFNSEKLAYEIFNSKIPIISAVGHATDTTICDLVADKSAPTPSAAAEVAVPNKTELLENLLYLKSKLNTVFENSIQNKEYSLEKNVEKLNILSPLNVLLRGYSIVKKDNKVIKSVNDFNIGDNFKLRLQDGILDCTVNTKGE